MSKRKVKLLHDATGPLWVTVRELGDLVAVLVQQLGRAALEDERADARRKKRKRR